MEKHLYNVINLSVECLQTASRFFEDASRNFLSQHFPENSKSQFYLAAGIIKQRAGLSNENPFYVREAADSTRQAQSCPLLVDWPLVDQLDFMESISGLSQSEQAVMIYDKVYALYKSSQRRKSGAFGF